MSIDFCRYIWIFVTFWNKIFFLFFFIISTLIKMSHLLSLTFAVHLSAAASNRCSFAFVAQIIFPAVESCLTLILDCLTSVNLQLLWVEPLITQASPSGLSWASTVRSVKRQSSLKIIGAHTAAQKSKPIAAAELGCSIRAGLTNSGVDLS